MHMNVMITQPDDVQPGEKLPMIVFLHGAGERGDDYDLLCKHGVPKLFSIDESYDGIRAVTVSPQCPEGIVWTTLSLFVTDLIRSLIEPMQVDEDRITLTGLSMGGFGAWHIACDHPNMFAAIAPLCGGGMAWCAKLIKHLPIRVYHGEEDTDVLPVYSQLMVDGVRAAGGKVDFTLMPGVKHNCWTYAYEETDLLKWLSEQVRK